MSDISKFYFDDFILILDRGSFLVEVHAPISDPPHHNRIEDLPDWVFHSKLAIWLSQDNSPIYERSLAGEEVRRKFLSAKHRNESPSSASLA